MPKANFVALRGKGNPNEEDGAYSRALGVLYAVSYTLKMSGKGGRAIEGFFEYVVPPLEGFWWQEGTLCVNYADKSSFNWISVIRVPDFICASDVEWAKEEARRKKKIDCAALEFLTIEEGVCAQILHRGSYDDEPRTIALMDEFLSAHGWESDISPTRLHHEIYLSDPRKTAAENCKTIIRQPIKKVQ